MATEKAHDHRFKTRRQIRWGTASCCDAIDLFAGCAAGWSTSDITIARLVIDARRSGDADSPTPCCVIGDRTANVRASSASDDEGKRKKGPKIHMAVDTPGHLLALHVTPASVEDRGEVERLARTVRAVTDDTVELTWVDQGHTVERAASAAARHGIALQIVKLPEVRRGFVPLPRHRVVERSFAWATRLRRLVKDHGRYAETAAGLHVVAFACLTMRHAAALVIAPHQPPVGAR
jgi:transposase